MTSTANLRTLVFCTSFSPDRTQACERWNSRYHIWLKSLETSYVHNDLLLFIDDGSVFTPAWEDVQVIDDASTLLETTRVAIYKFRDHLGRPEPLNYPGWYRSFMFAAEFAARYGFEKVVHIESDAVILSLNLSKFINDYHEGWACLWCPRHNFPETAIQIIAGSGMNAFRESAKRGYEQFTGQLIEGVLPFTDVIRTFEGDRYGEYLDHVPITADYAAQLSPFPGITSYHWWLTQRKYPAEGDPPCV